MLAKIISFFFILFLAGPLLATEAPRPLPDDPYPKEPYPGEPPRRVEVPYSLGTAEAGKFGAKTVQFFPREDLNRILKVRVTGGRNNMEIREVRLIYADHGDERNELTLIGELAPGEVREALLDGRRLVAIELSVMASYFWKKAGKYRVDVVAYGN